MSREEEDERGRLPVSSAFYLDLPHPRDEELARPSDAATGHEQEIHTACLVERMRRPADEGWPRPPGAAIGNGEDDTEGGQACCNNCCHALATAMMPIAGLLLAFITCLRCSQCMSVSGIFGCLSCILQPLVCVWDWLRSQIGCMTVLGFAVQCTWQCIQFWTPLSVTVLAFWLLYRPDRFRPYVDEASLATLNLTHNDNATADILRYDLLVGLAFRNSHSRLSIRYLDVGATAFYNGTKLGTAFNSLPRFRQPPKNTTVFQGTVDVFSSEVPAELQRERAAGVVHVRVAVDLTLKYKVWFVDNVVFYKYDCWIWFSPPHQDNPALFHGDGSTSQCWRV